MADDTRTTRRALLGAGIGALVASVAHALGRPGAATAADNDPVIAGQGTTATATTSISNSANNRPVFVGQSVSGTGLAGSSSSGDGVRGLSESRMGVIGESTGNTGVFGHTDANGPIGAVVGETSQERGYGVFGFNLGSGTRASLAGPKSGVAVEVPNALGFVGVVATAGDAATALSVHGRARFTRSGRVSIAARRTFVDVAVPGGLEFTPLAFASLLVNRPGVWIQSVVPNPTTSRIRINLNKVASNSSSTAVSWLVLG